MRKACAILLVSILTGCGSIKVIPIKNDFGSEGVDVTNKPGVRFYRPAPHVWITCVPPSEKVNISEIETTTTPDKGKPEESSKTEKTIKPIVGKIYTATLIMLPDISQEYIIQWKSGFFGTVQPNFALSEGWNLNSFNSVINSGVTAELTAGAQASGIGTFALAGDGKLEEIPDFVGAGLYRLDKDKGTGNWKLGTRILALEILRPSGK